MKLEDFDYNLPKELIAQKACHPRDHCKLLIVKDKVIHKQFFQIIDYLQKGDVLVLNETKVKPAKLVGKKLTGGKVEVIITEKLKPNYYECRIKCEKIKIGTQLIFKNSKLEVSDRIDDLFYVKGKIDKKDLLIPTPPYVKQKVPEKDYQTVFAKKEGSLAAPTAGLHFSPKLLEQIKKKGAQIAKIRLDISYETFLPVRDLNNHKTGKEYFEIDTQNAALINKGIQNNSLISVGTTVIKCLESCERKGWMILPGMNYSQIFIKPGHQFKTQFKAIITNFHLPKSSLLLLVSAYFDWGELKKAYEEAAKKKYRFFSLGDAMMIFKK